MAKNNDPDFNEFPKVPPDEVVITVEKDSPEDKILQVLKHKGIDAEITAWDVKTGKEGGFQLVKLELIAARTSAASACTIWAIILPSGRPYLLSAWGPGEQDFPLDLNLVGKLLDAQIKAHPRKDQENDKGGIAP